MFLIETNHPYLWVGRHIYHPPQPPDSTLFFSFSPDLLQAHVPYLESSQP
jgi:hypothetical protein